MTQQALNDKVHEAAGTDQTKANTRAIVGSVFDCIADGVKTENRFHWHGLGSFKTCERPARDSRHPQTGKAMKLKASTSVAFRPATALKEQLGQKGKATVTGKKTSQLGSEGRHPGQGPWWGKSRRSSCAWEERRTT